MRALARLSFTTRLMIVAFVAAVGPIAVAYVAMLDLPRTVAGDSLELALRESASTALGNLREQRLALREEVAVLAEDEAFRRAVLGRDRERVATYLGGRAGGTLRFGFQQPGSAPLSTSPVNAPVTVSSGRRSTTLLVYRPVDQAELAELAPGTVAPFALARGPDILAATKGFPKLRTSDVLVAQRRSGSTEVVTAVGGERLHLFARPVGLDARHQVLVASTPSLERQTLEAPTRDVTRTLLFLALASAAFAAIGAFAVNRGIRTFSRQARTLSAGEYDARLPVRGTDAFGELARSFNQLAEEVQRRVGELQATASTYARTLESIDDGVCLWRNDRIVLWSPSAERMTGATLDDLRDDHPLATFLRDELAPGSRRVRLPSLRGERLVVELTVTPVEGVGALQTFRDMTMVEVLHQTRRNFMATAAHELRTPLTSILGFSSTLDDGIELDEEQRRTFIRLIREQAEQLQRLIDAFFVNAQLANERVEIAIDRVELLPAVRAGIEKAGRADGVAAMERAPVDVQIDPRYAVQADRRALEGIVAVLVENAWKYGRPPVRIDAVTLGDSVLLRVHDSGGGIDPQYLDRLFDPFFRVDVDMRTGVGGAGLGLFTARKLVNAMKGVISVESSDEAGTTFTLELRQASRGAGDRATANIDATEGGNPHASVDDRKPGSRV